jgi:hypothetical protein
MINAEATAEKRPAYRSDEYGLVENSRITYEDQGGIQVFIILFQEFLVVFFSNLAVYLVELGLVVLMSGQSILVLAV